MLVFGGRISSVSFAKGKALLATSQKRLNVGRFETVEENTFMPRGVAAQQLNFATRTAEFFREKFHERLIGGGIHGRRGDFDFQFVAERGADLIFGSARLELHGQQSAAGRFPEKGRRRHAFAHWN